MKRLVAGCLGALGAMVAAVGAAEAQQAGQTVEVVRQRGTLRCGVQGPSNPGFGAPDSRGVWQGFNIDLCRAIAIMVLGDPSKITIVPLSTQARFPAMQSGEIDVMTNSTTWTMQRDAQLGFNFPAIIFYDGQGIMVRRSMGIDSATKLDGATICAPPGTTTELNLADWFRARSLRFTPRW
jgi:general L-amino acid transport system substrate-binding protein